MNESETNQHILIAIIAAGAIFFAFQVSSALSPLLIFIILLFIAQPLRSNPLVDRLFWGINILFGIWIFSELSGLLAPFIIAFVLAYLFEPLMNFLLKNQIPRVLSALLITFFGVGGIALVIVLLLPEIASQISAFAGIIPMIPGYLQNVINWVFSFEVFSWFSIDIESITSNINALFKKQFEDIGSLATNFTQTILKSIPKVISAITTVLLLPFLTFWFLNDFDKFSGAFRTLLNKRPDSPIHKYILMAREIFNQYVRGLIIVMTIEMVLYSTAFSIIGLNYPLLLGMISGAALWLPYIGISTAILLTSLVIALGSNPTEQFFWAGLTYLSIQALEILFMVPKIVGGKVHLNPIILFLSIILFGYFFGIPGIFVSIPVSAFIVAVIREKLYSSTETLIEESS